MHLSDVISIRPAGQADIEFIMSVERLPGYARRIGMFDADHHLVVMSRPSTRYIIAEMGGTPAGFAVLKQDSDRNSSLNLERFAVSTTGNGVGAAFLQMLCREVFSQPGVARLWLDVLPENAAARGLYAKFGFAEEGLMRDVLRLPDGKLVDLYLMALTRTDWLAL